MHPYPTNGALSAQSISYALKIQGHSKALPVLCASIDIAVHCGLEQAHLEFDEQ